MSQLDVAQFPWDPKPEPPPPAAPAAPPASSAQNSSQPKFAPQLPQGASGLPQNGIKQEFGLKDESDARIKQEPGTTPGFNGADSKNNVAAHRAAQLVQQSFGDRGTGSINAIQDRIGQQPGQPPQPQLQQGQAMNMPQQQSYPQQGQPNMPQQQQQYPTNPGQASFQNTQTDGAVDDEEDFGAVLMQRGAAGELQELGRVEIDSLLHQHIAANAKSMEGGGLMLPLKEATRHKSRSNAKRREKGVAAHDGGDDDEEDEDAINSDLDDSEDNRSEDEVDDEGLGHIMLCMYDKVQRVKNKW